jgi:predicted transcriptional regulator
VYYATEYTGPPILFAPKGIHVRLFSNSLIIHNHRAASSADGDASSILLFGGLMRQFGELEAAIMDVLWNGAEPMRVRDVLDELNQDRDLAYTTVMTVLTNLHRKGWVEREMEDRAYRYRTVTTREEATAQTLRDLLDSAGDRESVLLHFVSSASEEESDILRRALRRKARKR